MTISHPPAPGGPVQDPADFGPNPVQSPPVKRTRPTSIWVWLVVIALVLALMLVRMSLFIEAARAQSSDLVSELGDPALADSALTLGAAVSIGVAIGVLALFALIISLVESRLTPPPRPEVTFRIGPAGLTFTVLLLAQHISAVALHVPSVSRTWPVFLFATFVAFLSPLVFPSTRSNIPTYLKALGATVLTGALLCLQ
ncbi:hypothetical protein [Humidisolicoccus flavus]|uniref:hypothetical protein n=1 Tax=Humidisolicoccus flavus TaxID=3111414 RepID=UPI003253D878